MENRKLLISGARLLGVSLDTSKVKAFMRLLAALERWNQRMNLTALREGRSIIVQHFLDSLTLVKHLPERVNLLDIGSGAGFPGIPLKIARPRFEVVLLEASRKKTYFHRHIIRSLNLSGIRSVWGRSDQEKMKTVLGNRFDVVVSRAVSPLEILLEDAVHFLHTGGIIIAMRGKDTKVPIRLESLSLMMDRTVAVDLPFGVKRNLQFFRKVAIQSGE